MPELTSMHQQHGELVAMLVGQLLKICVYLCVLVAQKSMKIAADCCVYTNHNFLWHHIQQDGKIVSGSSNGAVGNGGLRSDSLQSSRLGT